MNADISKIHDTARKLVEAARLVTPIEQISKRQEISLKDAYDIQLSGIRIRSAYGERPIGIKMGFTSRAKMSQMGITDLIWGRLTDQMMCDDGGVIPASRFIHPRAEPELAFLLKAPLAGKVTSMEALQAVSAIAPAIELIDSRYEDFNFCLTDVIADNSSASAFVTGAWQSPTIDFANLGLAMMINGRPQTYGSTAALLGHPLRSLVAAARLVGESNERLEPGSIVLAGGATAAIALSPGDYVSVEMEQLGRCDLTLSN